VFPEDGTTVDELVDAARSVMLHGPSSRRASPPLVRGERSRAVWDLVERVASSVLPVLVIGETGTGKEVVAQALHRRSGPMKSINCAAIPQNLLESVLFGHEKGAFTGADRQSKGVFEQADGGTLFLDEVGELPAGAQAALLRVLETKKIVRVGGDKEISVDVRVVAATHRDLEQMGREGSFRTDLYYRLHGVTIALPPLRERTDEIGPLADAFLHEACRENGRSVRGIDPSALAALQSWRWPGNVRELKNVIERAVVIARGDVITIDDLPERLRAPAPARISAAPADVISQPGAAPNEDYKDRLRREMARYETELIVNALAAANGNVTAAAQALRIPVRTLTHKMTALGIKKRFDSSQ
jgi:DNA-binding NtrC family response regulator